MPEGGERVNSPPRPLIDGAAVAVRATTFSRRPRTVRRWWIVTRWVSVAVFVIRVTEPILTRIAACARVCARTVTVTA